MHRIGLTGGIASGKSTVANRFKARGLSVSSADHFAREVVQPGSAGLAFFPTPMTVHNSSAFCTLVSVQQPTPGVTPRPKKAHATCCWKSRY